MILTALFAAAGLIEGVTTADLGPAFANTLVSTYPDGRTARLWLEPNGRYRGESRNGRANSGVWRLRGDEICLSQRRPMPVPITYCTPVVRGGVGAEWSARAVTGEAIRVRLVRGR